MLQNTSTTELVTYLIVYYLLYSAGGLYFMIDYIRRCNQNQILPFNNSIWKGFWMLSVCGLFTQIALVIGTISAFIDIFRKKN